MRQKAAWRERPMRVSLDLSCVEGALMFAGHYCAAFALAAARPKTPVWPLVLGVQALDVIWAGPVLTGIERVEIKPGHMAASDLDLVYMPWSHSLPAALIWSCALGFAWAAARRSRAEGGLVGLAVFSHWIADLIVHGPDLQLWPGGPFVGLGLWNSLLWSQALEIGLLLGAFALWVGAARPALARASALSAAMVGVHAISHLGPPPAGPATIAAQGLAVYLALAGLAYWLVRPEKSASRVKTPA
jgi:hypothetical protein